MSFLHHLFLREKEDAKRKEKRGLTFRIRHHVKRDDEEHHEIKEIFVGHRTVFTLAGFSIGGILIGRSLWEYSHVHLGLPTTILIGMAIFAISGYVIGQFREEEHIENAHPEDAKASQPLQ